MTQYDLDLLKIDLSIEQKCRTIGNLLMLHCPHCSVGSDCIVFLSKLTLDIKDDPDLELFQMYICMRISRF